MISETMMLGGTNSNSDVVESLKEHLKVKYPWYNDQQIEELIYKFLNEYLTSQIGDGGQVEYARYPLHVDSHSQNVGDNPNDYILLEKDDLTVLTLKGSFTARDHTVFVDHKKY